jgi:hypothetical protein
MSNKPRAITDYFKSFTIPKNHIPRQSEDDEIIVVSSNPSGANTRERTLSPAKRRVPVSPQEQHRDDTNTVKRGRGRPRKGCSTSPSEGRLETPGLEPDKSGHSTSTRRSSRKQTGGMDEIQDVPPDSSGLTSVRSSLMSTSTKSRILEAVEIPSPVRRSGPSMPARSHIPASESRKMANTSFSSFPSSQSSSRRIVKNGVQAVTNSDSASVSSTSSEDELVDLDSLGPRKKRKISPPAGDGVSGLDVPSNSKSTRSSTRLSGGQAETRVRDSWRPLSPPPKPKYKHSLLSMARQSVKEAASKAKIDQMEADMQEEEELQKRRENMSAKSVETKRMAKELANNSEDEERMIKAMERTDVMRGEETFYFFRAAAHESMGVDFPISELDSYGLEFLQDDVKRQHACSSGFLATVASKQGLPEQLVSWLRNEISQEPVEELCESYVAIMDETYSGQTFRDVEGTKFARGTSLPPNLKYALMTMAALTPQIAPVNQACALAELILLNNDEHIRSDIDLQLYIERAMQTILESNASDEDLQTVFRETTRQVLHASSISRRLLARAIASLPTTILLLHQLRRKLSLHILLDASIDEDIDVTCPSTGVRLLLRVKKHDSFHISEKTDYVTLHSLTDLLDIAIDVGFSDFSFLSQESQSRHKSAPSTESLFGHKIVSQSPEEVSFNAQVDEIVSHLRMMGSKIRDAGTSHLKRTEAKSAIERLVVRLECAVRTKPRPRKGVFDRAVMSSGALDGFLSKVESGSTASRRESVDGETTKQQAVHGGLRKQHKVTWREDVVGIGNAEPGVEEGDKRR